MIGDPDQDRFVGSSVLAMVSITRSDGSPTASMVAFGRHGDELFFMARTDSLKVRRFGRDPRVALTVVNPSCPLDFVTIEGVVEIITDQPDGYRETLIDAVLGHRLPYTREELVAMHDEPGYALVRVRADRVIGVVGASDRQPGESSR